jgi:spore coat polysaccharide biosynthesis protein SpsF
VNVLVVIQARMGSTRLPGKVLLPLAGRPLLERMLERVRAARHRFELCVATTTSAEDAPIVELCGQLGVHVHRGHPSDLLERHLGAARELGADVVVKVPSDCPLIDPGVIDRVLGAFAAAEPGSLDFVSNLQPPSWPDGNDVEVMTREALEIAQREATRPLEREHTTPFIWEHPERFRILNVSWETGLDYSRTHRFTIDYPEDYALISAVYDELHRPGTVFGLERILELCEQRPELMAHNARFAGTSWHSKHAGELRTMRFDSPSARSLGPS